MFTAISEFFGNPTFLSFIALFVARIIVSFVLVFLMGFRAVTEDLTAALAGALLIGFSIFAFLFAGLVFFGSLYSVYSIFTADISGFGDFILMVLFALIPFSMLFRSKK